MKKEDDKKKNKKQLTVQGEEVRHVYVACILPCWARSLVCWSVISPAYRCCRKQASTAMYFRYNTELGPPYHVLVGEYCQRHFLVKDIS